MASWWQCNGMRSFSSFSYMTSCNMQVSNIVGTSVMLSLHFLRLLHRVDTEHDNFLGIWRAQHITARRKHAPWHKSCTFYLGRKCTCISAYSIRTKWCSFFIGTCSLPCIWGEEREDSYDFRRALVSESIAELLVPNQSSKITLQMGHGSLISSNKWQSDRPKCGSKVVDPSMSQKYAWK